MDQKFKTQTYVGLASLHYYVIWYTHTFVAFFCWPTTKHKFLWVVVVSSSFFCIYLLIDTLTIHVIVLPLIIIVVVVVVVVVIDTKQIAGRTGLEYYRILTGWQYWRYCISILWRIIAMPTFAPPWWMAWHADWLSSLPLPVACCPHTHPTTDIIHTFSEPPAPISCHAGHNCYTANLLRAT